MTKLYQLTDEYARLLELAEDGEDVGAELALLEGDLESKGANIAKVITSLEADSETAGEESKRLAERSKSLAAQAKRVRDYLRSCMQASGIKRIKGPAFTISLSGGKRKVVVSDETKVPPEYMRSKTTFEPNKAAILEAFEQFGEVVPGTAIEETTTLSIR